MPPRAGWQPALDVLPGSGTAMGRDHPGSRDQVATPVQWWSSFPGQSVEESRPDSRRSRPHTWVPPHSAGGGIASASCRTGRCAGSGPSPGARDGGSMRECGGLVASSGPGPTAYRQLAEIAGPTANATVAQCGSGPAARGRAVATADPGIRHATGQAPATGCDRRRPGPFGSVPRHFPHRGEHIARLRQDRLLEPRSVGDPDI